MIEPDIDAYGTLARGSALADYLELLALAGGICSRAQLEDGVKDKYLSVWQAKHSHMILDADDFDDEGEFEARGESELAGHIEETFDCLYERAEILGSRYPFEILDEGLKVRADIEPTSDVYVATLCITLAHAYRVATQSPVTELFEDIVAETMGSRMLRVARLGELSRRHRMRFIPALAEAGEVLDIATDHTRAPSRRHANDGGADVLAHFSWHDRRLGRWTFAGQVTCGKSDSWQRKMGEASPGLWREYFQEKIDPLCFLAIPHHAPRRTLNYIVTEQGRLIVDRLRLVMAREVVTPVEAAVIALVLAQEVDNVAAA